MRSLNLLRDQRTELEQQRSKHIDAIENVANTALKEERMLTDADDREVTALNSAIEDMNQQLAGMNERETELVDIERRPEARAARPSLRTLSQADPWDGERSEVRSRAVGAIEASEVVPDTTRSPLVDAIEASDDQSTPLAQWALATSDPAYVRAFHKLTVNPNTAHVRMTDAEATAFAHVSEVQRAMSLTDAGPADGDPAPVDCVRAVLDRGRRGRRQLRQRDARGPRRCVRGCRGHRVLDRSR